MFCTYRRTEETTFLLKTYQIKEHRKGKFLYSCTRVILKHLRKLEMIVYQFSWCSFAMGYCGHVIQQNVRYSFRHGQYHSTYIDGKKFFLRIMNINISCCENV